MKVIYPGSFDPLTYGHIDIIKRLNDMFDEVVVAILINEEKKSLFTLDEREEMIREVIKENNLSHVKIKSFDGLLVNFAREEKKRKPNQTKPNRTQHTIHHAKHKTHNT